MPHTPLDLPERLRALAETRLMDSPLEESFDGLTRIAQRLLDVPIVLISLVDERRQFFKSAIGLEGEVARVRQTPLSHSFCQHVVTTGEPLTIDDAEHNPLVCDNLAIRDLGVRSYLAFPLRSPEGYTLGSVCAIGTKPRQWSTADHELLKDMAMVVNSRIELRLANRRFQANADRFSKLSDRIPGVVYQFLMRPDGTSCFPYASEAIRSVYGVAPEEVQDDASKVFAVLHPDDHAGIVDSILKSAETLTPWHHEYRVRFADGNVEWLLGDSMPERLPDGGTLWHGCIVNITESKILQARLKKSMNRYRQSFEYAGIGMATLDANERWLTANPALLAMLGYTMEELRPLSFASLTHPDDQHIASDLQKRLFAGEIPVGRTTKRYRRADGRYIWGHLTTTVIRDENGQPLEFITHLEDVTAMRNAEKERKELDRKIAETAKLESLGVLAGGIAHDFNNLLTGVLGNASIMQMDLPANSPLSPMVDQIETAARRAADLCRQMLAYSGKGRFVVRPINLNTVIRETARLLEISISKNTTLQFHLDSALPAIEADETQIRQIVMNLVINGSEAIGSKDGVVTISTGETVLTHDDAGALPLGDELVAGNYVWMEVTDSGSGMAPEVIARIFEPFFTTKFAGRGLGLAALQGIVRGHKGAIKVESTLGHGTTFHLLLPATKQAPVIDEGKQTPPAKEPQDKGTVLLVDDEETVRDVASRILIHAGFRVEQAEDGEAGLERFRQNPSAYTFVLLDLTMPRLDGRETFRLMRELNPRLPVLLMSGFNHQDVVTQFEGEGLAGFVAKPLDRETLLAAVHDLTQRSTALNMDV